MVEKYTGFKASDGSIHNTELEAYLHELRIVAHEIMGNEGLAATFVNRVATDPHYLTDIMSRISGLTPRLVDATDEVA